MRRGMSILEILVATMVMAVVAIPLMELYQQGVRTTRSSIYEVVGANLAAEVAEQLETLPHPSLVSCCGGADRLLASRNGTFADGTPVDGSYSFRLSPLPRGYERSLRLEVVADDVVVADVQVDWSVGGERERHITMRRALVRDEVSP